MCGFAGVVAWDDRYRVSRETLGRMSAAIAHRGPDGEGYHLNHEGEVTAERPQVGLAFRRLAIIDPDPRSNQPFTDGRHWLVFNGEIYNFRELRAELTTLDPGYEWRTTGDTEVLLRSYAVWGESCVEHLNGMFAFVVWDEQETSLFLARDRMGQKPLYFASSDSSFAFASELAALRHLPWIDTSVVQLQLALYLRFGFGESIGTIYAGIEQLAPASRMSVRRAHIDAWEGYFNQNAAGEFASIQDPVAQTRTLLDRAVRRQLISDVPLGCFLSGGVDSSVVASCMRAAGGDVSTFSIGFDDPRYDESPYASAVAKHFGTKHHEFVVRPNAAEDLPKLAAVFGEPFADSSALPTHYLSRETRRHVKVALSGDGGDELFGGYDRYRAMAWAERLRHAPRLVRKAISAGGRTLPRTHPKSISTRLRRFANSLDLPAGQRYASYLMLFDHESVSMLLRDMDEARAAANSYLSAGFESLSSGRDVVQTAMALDRVTYLPDDLLTKVDRASMLHALEVRSPFMDHELVQFAAGLTTDQLLKGGPKRMLREAFAADLPDFVFKRKKMGFAVPIGEWFRGELRPMLRDHLFAAGSFAKQHFNMAVVERLVDEHECERVDHSQRLYALLMLELWWRLQKSATD